MSQSNVVPLVRDGHPALLSVPKRTNLTFYYVGTTVFGFPGQPPPSPHRIQKFQYRPNDIELDSIAPQTRQHKEDSYKQISDHI